MGPLKIGVVGAGTMGVNHCIVIQKIRQAELTGIYDIQESRRNQISALFNCISYESFETMLENVQAVILALPSVYHFAYFAKAIKAGKDVLVEKPFVTTLEEVHAAKLLLSSTSNIVQVGHIERFNPVILMLRKVVNCKKLLAIEAHRCSLSNRSLDVDIALDLMIHDIDIILSFVSEPISSITSNAIVLPGRKLADFVTASITFQSGLVANLVSSRMSYRPERTLSILERNRSIQADYLDRSVSIYRLPQSKAKNTDTKFMIASTHDALAVPHGDALYEELAHFVDCVHSRKRNLADAWMALHSIEIIIEIQRQISKAQSGTKDNMGEEGN